MSTSTSRDEVARSARMFVPGLMPIVCWTPTLRTEIVRERWRASRLPSLHSALRGLDPHHASRVLAFVGASAHLVVRSARSSVLTPSWAHCRPDSRFMSVMPHALVGARVVVDRRQVVVRRLDWITHMKRARGVLEFDSVSGMHVGAF
jgi:hypothetical protein